MTLAVQRLGEGVRATLMAHFLALPAKDRCLRFGAPVAPAAIGDYVDRIDFGRDAIFGVHDDRLTLVGVAHMAVKGGLAELALSVLPSHRRRGVGSALFKRAVAHARDRSIPRLFMQFLAGNAPIMRMAQRFGMNIVAAAGNAEAHLALQPAGDPVIPPTDTHWSRILYYDLYDARAGDGTTDPGRHTKEDLRSRASNFN